MKIKIYTKYLMAPLSMLMIFACSPNQYQQSGEYDDIYFTKNDRKSQPEIVQQAQQAQVSQMTQQSTSAATIPTELQEKYSNNSGAVVYYEEQGARVLSASDLNYVDFLYDYDNGHLVYYDLPLDWDTDWSQNSFNDLMNNDFQFRMAWYEQYYEGDDWRMRQYLSGRSSLAAQNSNFYGPQVGIGMGFNSFGPGMYPGGMMAVDLNPWGFYDPFWRPINRFSVGFSFGWGTPYYCPPFAPIYNGGVYNNIYVDNRDQSVDQRTIVRGGRMGGSSVSSVQTDSQNGASIRARSQRLANTGASGGGSSPSIQRTSGGRVVASGRTSSTGSNSITRASINGNSASRVNTDAYRFDSGSRTSRITRSRVNASQVSSGRSTASTSRVSRGTSFTRADVARSTVSRNSRSSNYDGLSFSRNSSSSLSRSVSSRSSYNGSSSSSRGFSFGSIRNSAFSRSSGSPTFSGNSTSRSSGSFSRSSGSSSSRSSSSSGSRSSSSSSGSSRSGRN